MKRGKGRGSCFRRGICAGKIIGVGFIFDLKNFYIFKEQSVSFFSGRITYLGNISEFDLTYKKICLIPP